MEETCKQIIAVPKMLTCLCGFTQSDAREAKVILEIRAETLRDQPFALNRRLLVCNHGMTF